MNEQQAFWSWVTGNLTRLEAFESLPEAEAEDLLDEMQSRLASLEKGLFVQISVTQRPFGLVVTAHGDPALFPAVRELVAAAPAIPGWTVIAFKQAQPDLETCEWGGVTIALKSLRFQPLFSRNDPDRIALRFLVDGALADREETRSALQVITETLLGEELAATTIAQIQVEANALDRDNYAPVNALPHFIRQFRS